jgi:hypothetical protein
LSRDADESALAISAFIPKLGATMNTKIRSVSASALNALLLTLALAGCSKPPSAKSGPLVVAPLQDMTSTQTVKELLTSNHIQSRYSAHFQNGRMTTIDEARTGPDARLSTGVYSFYEARLVKYSGDGLNFSGHEEVEFDLHGAIKRSQAENGELNPEEIGAIRNRAELLRSHALAQQAIETHQPR